MPEVADLLARGVRKVPVLTDLDPPQHTRIRLQIARHLTPRRAETMRPIVEQRTNELIDGFAGTGAIDLVASLAHPLPALTMFAFLGFDESDTPQLKSWCNDKLEMVWGRPSPDYQRSAAQSMSTYWAYCENYVQRRKDERGGDFTSALLQQRKDGSDGLTDEEITSVVFALSFAGHETTTNLIGNAAIQLLSRPELWRRVTAELGLLEKCIDETLRFDSSVIAWRRQTTREVTLGGVVLPAGARLMLALGSANRDASRFAHPDEFDPSRPDARAQLSFGKGAHFCLGQHLARVEVSIVLRLLRERLSNLRLVPDQVLSFPPNISFRGPQHLLVNWDPSP